MTSALVDAARNVFGRHGFHHLLAMKYEQVGAHDDAGDDQDEQIGCRGLQVSSVGWVTRFYDKRAGRDTFSPSYEKVAVAFEKPS